MLMFLSKDIARNLPVRILQCLKENLAQIVSSASPSVLVGQTAL